MNPTDNISSLLIDHIMGMSIMIYRYIFYLSELIMYVSILRTIVYNRSIYFAIIKWMRWLFKHKQIKKEIYRSVILLSNYVFAVLENIYILKPLYLPKTWFNLYWKYTYKSNDIAVIKWILMSVFFDFKIANDFELSKFLYSFVVARWKRTCNWRVAGRQPFGLHDCV